jgi:hypothetical protein
MEKPKKKPSVLLTLGTAVALIAGGGAAYWLIMRGGLGSGDLPTGAEVIPQDALMTISVSTDPAQWQRLREFGTAKSQAAFNQNLAQLRDRILTANGYNYEQDIQPWVGKEVTVAFLSPSVQPPAAGTPSPTPPQQQATVMVLPIQDALQAKQHLEKPKSASAAKQVERVYKGFQVRETQGAVPQNYSATVLDGKFLVVTTDPKATDRAIDTYKGGAALATTPDYAQALRKIQSSQSFGKVYVNLPVAAAMTSASSGRSLSPQSLAQIQQNQGLAATIALEPDGVRIRSASWRKPDSNKYAVQNSAKTMPDRLPADTLIMASGGNLKQFWQDYSRGAATTPGTGITPESLRTGIKSTIGMDLEQDLLPWMEGEFSLSLVSAPDRTSPNFPFSLVFMVKSSDRRAGEKALGQLDQTMANKYRFKVDDTKVSDQPVTNLTFPLGGLVISHGWLNGDVAFLSMGAPIASAIVPKPSTSLADSDAFKKAIPSEPDPNNGHFFVNVDRAVNAKELPLLQLPPGNRDFLTAIRAIGVTAAISDERTVRYDIFIALQKTGNPSPLPSPTIPSITPSPSPDLGIPPSGRLEPSPLPTR